MKEGVPRPFLKWVGGKRQLLPKLIEAVNEVGCFKRYHEPFLGGGALFFALARGGRLNSPVFLSDINHNLVAAYQGLRADVGTVIRLLKGHKQRHCEEYFYRVRRSSPRTLSGRAARIIYLNKTCFNGLYRENKKGQFNAPFGSYANPNICDEENLCSVAMTLQRVDVASRDFGVAADLVGEGDLVYFDPPYDPVSKTAAFTGYSKGGFGVDAQERLADTFMSLAQKGAHVILSNSLTPLTRELYADFCISHVLAKRLINSRADKRGEVPEVVVTTFSVGGVSSKCSRINGQGVEHARRLERMLTKQWLIENKYEDVAKLIDEVVEEWSRAGKQTRRSWWGVLAGTVQGKSRIVGGREFPVLRAAQRRQGLPITPNAIYRSDQESPPPKKVTGRWAR